MPYPALPDRRMPYDIDGTLVYRGTPGSGATTAITGSTLLEINDHDLVSAWSFSGTGTHYLWFFFPEQREITGAFFAGSGGVNNLGAATLYGSNDTANGIDGTWETASLPGGNPSYNAAVFDTWRSGIKAVSFTGPKQTLRVGFAVGNAPSFYAAHVYGEAAGGAMAHDLIFINHDDTPGAEFTAPEDFGDQPLGTTVTRQWRIKNTSATKTATNINLQCNDPDFVISTDGVTWVVTINIASLAPGAESATFWTRCTTPAPGAGLAPRHGRITVITDAGFFG